MTGNHCTRYLARDSTDARHDSGQYEPGDARAVVCEAWGSRSSTREVGAVNYIDKLWPAASSTTPRLPHLSENRRGLLRSRFGGLDPLMLAPDVYVDLYAEMAINDVEG